jgi:hypothetical protein
MILALPYTPFLIKPWVGLSGTFGFWKEVPSVLENYIKREE